MSEEFPDPRHWIEAGESSRTIYLDVFDPSILDGGGVDGEPMTGCGDGCNQSEELPVEDLASLGDRVAEIRARIPGGRVGITTENYERYIGGPSLERPICVHEVPKLVALDIHSQISYLFRSDACDEPCLVNAVGPPIPDARKVVLRRAVARIDTRAVREFLSAWRAPLIPPELVSRIEQVRDLGADALARLGLDTGTATGVKLRIVDAEGWWKDWKSPEYASARALVGAALLDASGMAPLRERMQAGADGSGRWPRFAWIVHEQGARLLRDLASARETEARRFPALDWLDRAGTKAGRELAWDRLVMLVKKLVVELGDMQYSGADREPTRIIPTDYISEDLAQPRRATRLPRLGVLIARLRAALAVAEESDPVSAVFHARTALDRSREDGVGAALHEMQGPNSLGEGCDDPNAWRALDTSPHRRTCDRLAALA